MTETTELSETKLAEIRDEFNENVNQIRELPDRINTEFDRLRGSDVVLYMIFTGVRDDIQEKLKELMDALEQVIEGAFAPWLFVDYASQWQQDIAEKISFTAARLNDREFSMEGNWDGSAYKSYKDAATAYQLALTASKDLCIKIHDQLLIIAEEGRLLYKSIIDKLATIVAEAGVVIGESASTGGAALVWTVNDFNAAIVASVELIVEAITGFLELQTKVVIASNELVSMIQHPTGMNTNTDGTDAWPGATSSEYDNKEDGWEQDGAK